MHPDEDDELRPGQQDNNSGQVPVQGKASCILYAYGLSSGQFKYTFEKAGVYSFSEK